MGRAAGGITIGLIRHPVDDTKYIGEKGTMD